MRPRRPSGVVVARRRDAGAQPDVAARAMWLSWLAVRLSGLVLLTGAFFYPQVDQDLFGYFSWAIGLRTGHLPWSHGFFVEYPPGVFPAMLLPGGRALFELEFIIAALVADAYIANMVWRHRRNSLGAWCWVLAPVAIGPIIWVRFDIFVAAALCGLVKNLRQGNWRRAGACIGAATLLKLWPIALLVVLWRLIPVAGRRRVAGWTLGTVAAAVLPVVAWGGGAGLVWMLQFQGGRGLEWETPWALPAVLAHSFHPSVPLYALHGSVEYNLSAAASAAWGALLPALLVAVAATVWFDRSGRHGIGSACLLTVAAVLLGSKVLSPQYLTWVVALAVVAIDDEPLHSLRQRMHLVAATFALGVTTQLMFPFFATYAFWGYFRGDLAAIMHAEAVVVWICVAAWFALRRVDRRVQPELGRPVQLLAEA